MMYDGPSPYWHGLYPFSMLRLNPVIWSFWGLSKYQNLIPLNKCINEIGAGTMDMIRRALNPQMLAKENSIVKDAFERFFPNMPGGKLKMTNMSDVQRDVRYMDPPQLPAYVFQFFQAVSGEFDRLSGAVDTGKMTGKKQMPGGDAIEQLRDAANLSIRLEGRYIEDFLRDTGTLAISNIFQMYTAKQRLRILGANGLTWQDFDYNPGSMVPDAEKAPRSIDAIFFFRNCPGSLLGTNKTQEKTAAMTLFKLQAAHHALPYCGSSIWALRWSQIEKELVKEVPGRNYVRRVHRAKAVRHVRTGNSGKGSQCSGAMPFYMHHGKFYTASTLPWTDKDSLQRTGALVGNEFCACL